MAKVIEQAKNGRLALQRSPHREQDSRAVRANGQPIASGRHNYPQNTRHRKAGRVPTRRGRR